MAETESSTHPFVEYLESLAAQQQRGDLAALRRGLGRPPGTVPEMFRYVVPYLPLNAPPWTEAAYYVVASLFAFHPLPAHQGNLGDAMAAARTAGHEDALERRFTILLASHPDDLPGHLRQAISLLRSKEIPVNYHQLLWDVQNWGHPTYGDRVRRSWATAFWRYRPTPQSEGQD